MKAGYARVSTKDQAVDLQVDALKKAGCTMVYTEIMSGTRAERPILSKLLENLRTGDVLVCIGSEFNYSKVDYPLVRNLMKRGLIRPGPANFGVDALSNGAIIGCDGASSVIFTFDVEGPIELSCHLNLTDTAAATYEVTVIDGD